MKNIKRSICLMLLVCIIVNVLTIGVSAKAKITSIPGSGYFYIKNKAGGKYLDITDESTENGARLQIWSKYKNHQNQVFRFEKKNDYWIIYANNSGKALEVRDSRTDVGAPVAQWDYSKINCQRWKITSNPDGTFSFKNVNSGKYMTVYGDPKKNGTKIVQKSKNNNPLQRFYLYQLGTEDVLNAKWTKKYTNSNVSWTKFSLNDIIYNQTRFVYKGKELKYPTAGKKYLVKIEYFDRESVWNMTKTKSLDKSTLNQIKDVIVGEGIEAAASIVLKKIGCNIPGVGIAVGVCEVLSNRNSESEWNKFVNTVKYDGNGGNSGIKKTTYVEIVKNPVRQPINNATTGVGYSYYIRENKTYEYEVWDGDPYKIVAPSEGTWDISFK